MKEQNILGLPLWLRFGDIRQKRVSKPKYMSPKALKGVMRRQRKKVQMGIDRNCGVHKCLYIVEDEDMMFTMMASAYKGLSRSQAVVVPHGYGFREPTELEWRRCQGFPDSFVLKGTKRQRYEQIGRAVPPPGGPCCSKGDHETTNALEILAWGTEDSLTRLSVAWTTSVPQIPNPVNMLVDNFVDMWYYYFTEHNHKGARLMVDNIRNQDFFFQRTPAWHRKGTKLPDGATLAQAQELAGHNFEVEMVDVSAGNIPINGWCATVRTDTNEPLGMVKDTYRIIQPSVLYDVLRPVLGESAAHLDCGGTLGKGEKIWVLAKLPNSFYIPGVRDDVIDHYLLIVNSFDRSLPLTLRSTPVRVVCQNTLVMALRGKVQADYRIFHRPGAGALIDIAHSAMGIMTQHQEYLSETAGAMARFQMGVRATKNFLKRLFPSAPEEEGRPVTEQTLKKRERVELLFSEVDRNNLPGMRGTAWALYNAIVEYIDHERPAREGTDELDRMWFGSSYDVKTTAARLLMKQIKGGSSEGIG
jgi:phage/plasmid-like protein (TIGR03299 family)